MFGHLGSCFFTSLYASVHGKGARGGEGHSLSTCHSSMREKETVEVVTSIVHSIDMNSRTIVFFFGSCITSMYVF